ncbi:hypothetical protein D3C76_1236460 [compost metagenome]
MIKPVGQVFIQLLNSGPSNHLINVCIVEFVFDWRCTESDGFKSALSDSSHHWISINQFAWDEAPIAPKWRGGQEYKLSASVVFDIRDP